MRTFYTILFWVLAVLITISAAVYQRMTGPTYEKRTTVTIENNEYTYKLPRSHFSTSDCPVELNFPEDMDIQGTIFYRRFPTNENWKEKDMTFKNGTLKALLPKQAPAGKLEYYIEVKKDGKVIIGEEASHAVIRYKGEVPDLVLIPHVIIMFIAMLLSNITGIMAIAGRVRFKLYGMFTFITLLVGGMILGPIMQKYAFGQAWTGIPVGWDLTDNKTLIAFIFWIIAIVMNRKKGKPAYAIIASVVMLIVYLIPHSMLGSELDYQSGEVITGMVNWMIW